MRYTIIGGGGFIGSHLSEALLAAGCDVTVFDRPRARYLHYLESTGVKIRIGNFLNSRDLSRSLEHCNVVFHLGSTTVPQTSNNDPINDIESNLVGTLKLLDAARAAKVNKIIFASSGGTVYGIPQEIPIKENHPTHPISSYGIIKLAIEKYLHLYWTLYGLDYCILRIANGYGPRQPVTETQGVISSFLDKSLRKEEVVIWGDGSVLRDYIYVGDIVEALVTAAGSANEHKIFNIGSGIGHSLNDIIKLVENITQQPLRVKYNPGRRFDVPVNVLDIALARTGLNWEPVIGLPEGITYAYEWMKKNRAISKSS